MATIMVSAGKESDVPVGRTILKDQTFFFPTELRGITTTKPCPLTFSVLRMRLIRLYSSVIETQTACLWR
jgi:hypothetical protein